MVLFWGVVWPWMLGRMHRVSAAHCLERVVREVCAGQEAACVAAPGARRYRSAAQILGIPLVSIAMGPDPTSDQLRGVAKGFVAIGDVAVGVVAIGGVAVGGVALGGLAIGGLALGGAALGLCAVGGAAVGLVALGGLAIGILAVGGGAYGIVTIDPGFLGRR
jgi:hypothetical protein